MLRRCAGPGVHERSPKIFVEWRVLCMQNVVISFVRFVRPET
ncbi:hypothetical protein GQ55_2G014600 [Panicum hallii var. hallii]|uniref:Uncharacterized protein n=1 Tax=Panicum hallii var. hallii TaxID=1504633 RepID=A0A2T7EKD4_9POAL|nr:hypothetical protein GQ55_2G014600 [Panicum hallii var. hallii]